MNGPEKQTHYLPVAVALSLWVECVIVLHIILRQEKELQYHFTLVPLCCSAVISLLYKNVFVVDEGKTYFHESYCNIQQTELEDPPLVPDFCVPTFNSEALIFIHYYL